MKQQYIYLAVVKDKFKKTKKLKSILDKRDIKILQHFKNVNILKLSSNTKITALEKLDKYILAIEEEEVIHLNEEE